MISGNESIAQRIYTPQGFIRESLGSLDTLHLGCGSHKIPGAIGVDRLALFGVDVVHDLEHTPWPFPDSSFDVVVLHAVLEHLQPFLPVMEEIHRIGRPGARVVISVPYFRSIDAFSDPTHVRFFTSASLDYVLEREGSLAGYRYSDKRFRLIGFWYGWPQLSHNIFARTLKWIAHRHPRWYDQYLSIIFPFKILVWEIEIDK